MFGVAFECNGCCRCAFHTRDPLAVPLHVLCGTDDDAVGCEARILWLSHLEMHGTAAPNLEIDVSTRPECAHRREDERGAGQARRRGTPEPHFHRVIPEAI